MSISSDIRSYADSALEQGKQVLDQAQSQLNGFSGTARENLSDLTAKATEAVNDFRAQAEKAINVDAIKTAIEPYLARTKGYTSTVTDRAEDLFASVRNDKRVALVVSKAEAFTGTVVETVQERVVKPVQSLTGRGTKPAPKRTPATTTATRPVATASAAKPAPRKTASAKPAARKATPRKAAAK
jgi:hypothetical protein